MGWGKGRRHYYSDNALKGLHENMPQISDGFLWDGAQPNMNAPAAPAPTPTPARAPAPAPAPTPAPAPAPTYHGLAACPRAASQGCAPCTRPGLVRLRARPAAPLAFWPVARLACGRRLPGLWLAWPPGRLAAWPPGRLATWPPGRLAARMEAAIKLLSRHGIAVKTIRSMVCL